MLSETTGGRSARQGTAELTLERVEQASLLRIQVPLCFCFEQVEHGQRVAGERGIDRHVDTFGAAEVRERGAREGHEEGRERHGRVGGHGHPHNEVLPPVAMPRLHALLLASLLAVSAAYAPQAAAAPPTMNAEQMYALGLKQLRTGYYTKALETFNRVRTYYRDDPYSLKAELAIADVHYKKTEWDEARIAYEDFMRAHPRYPELDLVIYRLGMVLYKKAPIVPDRDQTWTRQTVNTWVGFGARFPESEHRPEVEKFYAKAQDRLARKELTIAQFYARRESWPSVVGRVEPMLRAWPDCGSRGEAQALYGKALHQLGNADAARAVLEQLRASPADARWARRLEADLARPVKAPKLLRTG